MHVRLGITFLVAAIVGLLGPVAASQQASEASHAVTFTRDIAPILQRSCQSCHRPQGVAPMPLATYEEVRPYARAIKQRTGLRDRPGVMPPWFIDKTIGVQHFKDDISLSEEESAAIARWADSGALRGNPADMPPPRVFADNSVWQTRPSAASSSFTTSRWPSPARMAGPAIQAAGRRTRSAGTPTSSIPGPVGC